MYLKIIITYISIIISIISLVVLFYYLNNKKNDSYNFNAVNNPYGNVKIYVINLEKRTDRKEHMIKLLNKLGFTNYTFVVPVRPEEAALHPMMNGSKLSGSEMSVTITTFNIMREVIDEEFMIMEDDLTIMDENYTFTDIYDSSRKYDWDLLYLEFCWDKCDEMIKVSDCLYKLSRPSCAACIMYKKSIIPAIISNYDNNFLLDRNYPKFSKEGIIRSYGYPLFKQATEFDSNVEGSTRWINKGEEDPICF